MAISKRGDGIGKLNGEWYGEIERVEEYRNYTARQGMAQESTAPDVLFTSQ